MRGDSYAGDFSCGLTMSESGTMEGFSREEGAEETTYRNGAGVVLTVKSVPDGLARRIRTTVYNGSDGDIELEMLASVVIREIRADRIHRLQSFWSAEGKLRTETVEELHLEPSWSGSGLRIEKFGNVGSMPVRKYFPFLALENGQTGEFLGIQLYCAFSWQMEIRCREDETLTVSAGLADEDFGHWMKRLAPGESFEAPEAVAAEGNSLEQVCRRLVAAQHPRISPVDDHMGIIFNEYCTTWANPSLENIRQICDRLEGKGVQYLVIDSGWYGKGSAWWSSIGDWNVNRERFPGGMKEAADYIRSRGMIPGLWFEPETLAAECAHYQEAEHLVKKHGRPLTVGSRRFWDMEDPWVADYLEEKVIRQLKESGFGYLKVDYNDTMGMGCDGAESPGEGLRRKVEASKRFLKRIAEELPELVIENCSSGGHRLEPSMMALVSQASFSDAHETRAIPLIAANMHRVIRPEQSQIWAVLRAEDSRERIYYSLVSTFLGRMCLSGDIYALSKEQWAAVEEGMAFYRKVSDIIRDGHTILQQTSAGSYNEPQGEQLVVRELGNRGLALLHRFEHSALSEPAFPEGSRILAEYGSADRDFSAKAWLYEKQEEKTDF